REAASVIQRLFPTEKAYQGRHHNWFLIVMASQAHHRPQISVIFNRGGHPRRDSIADQARSGEGDTAMGSGSLKWLFKRKIHNKHQPAEAGCGNWAHFQSQGLLLGRTTHVIQFDVAAESYRPRICRRDRQSPLARSATE